MIYRILSFGYIIISILVIITSDLYADNKAIQKPVPERDIKAIEKELSSMTKIADTMNKERVALKEDNNRLRGERAGIYEELGTAYTKAGLYDEAIEAYKSSLSFNPDNAKVHYYLGLLYQKSMNDPEKAAFHFKKYLYLNPDAKDKKEVWYLIDMVLNKR